MYLDQEGIRELEQNGICIENVCGTEKSGTFFLCMSKAMIMFLVCTGTVTAFCDAFEMPYNKPVIIIYTLFVSILTAFLLYKKKSIYIGLAVIFGLFTAFLSQASIPFSGGLRALSDIIREAYADHYNEYLAHTPNPYYEDDYVSITVAMLFIIVILLILFNITIVRYTSFAETFAISLIILEIPMFIGKKPGLISLALIITGCIATGLLKNGSFDNINLHLTKPIDYIKENKGKNTGYTTAGTFKGVLCVIAFSICFTLFMLAFSPAAYKDNAAKTKESDIKIFLDEKAEIVAVKGFPGLFEEEAKPVYIGRGELGKLDKLESDNQVDMVLTFVPYTSKTMYLPGFWGSQYKDAQWYDSIKTSDFPELGFSDVESIDAEILNGLAKQMKSQAVQRSVSPTAKIQITYTDEKFDNYIFPYYNPQMEWVSEQYYKPKADKDGNVPEYETRQASFYVPDSIKYYDAENPYLGYGVYGAAGNLRMLSVTVPGSKKLVLYGDEYIDRVCLDVPEELDPYLEEFITAHENFHVEKPDVKSEEDITYKSEDYYYVGVDQDLIPPLTIPDGVMDTINDDLENGSGKVKIIVSDVYGNTYEITRDRDMGFIDRIISSNPNQNTDFYSYTITGSTTTIDKLRKMYEEYDIENEYRLKVCEALKEMFSKEYLYTLSPGKTPLTEDYVRYFLESQKQGVCTHFASSAVMLLRHMGIPARYVEGYCVPSSLVKKNGKTVKLDGEEWYPGENTYNPKKKALSVEVTDYYAHAWVEVYLEGIGFVPFEMTPAAYVQAPLNEETLETETKPATVTPAVKKPATVTSAPNGVTNAPDKEGSGSTVSTTTTTTKKEHIETDTERLIKIFLLAIGTGLMVWILFIGLKRALKQLRISGYIKKGKYRRLVFLRYSELVERLRRKNIVTAPNPLPMELCEIISGYVALEEAESVMGTKKKAESIKNDKGAVAEHSKEGEVMGRSDTYTKVYKRVYDAYSGVFKYLEKVLYGGYETNASEYNDFYCKLRILK